MTLDDQIKKKARQIQNSLNVRRGRNFELTIQRTLKRHGYLVKRVNEVDGFSHGSDLLIMDTHWWNVPVQCKIGAEPKLGFRGLREARRANPKAPLVVCFFKHVPTVFETRIHYKIYIHRLPAVPNTYEYMELPEFLETLDNEGLALLSTNAADRM
jgi:hypothetical protein